MMKYIYKRDLWRSGYLRKGQVLYYSPWKFFLNIFRLIFRFCENIKTFQNKNWVCYALFLSADLESSSKTYNVILTAVIMLEGTQFIMIKDGVTQNWWRFLENIFNKIILPAFFSDACQNSMFYLEKVKGNFVA